MNLGQIIQDELAKTQHEESSRTIEEKTQKKTYKGMKCKYLDRSLLFLNLLLINLALQQRHFQKP